MTTPAPMEPITPGGVSQNLQFLQQRVNRAETAPLGHVTFGPADPDSSITVMMNGNPVLVLDKSGAKVAITGGYAPLSDVVTWAQEAAKQEALTAEAKTRSDADAAEAKTRSDADTAEAKTRSEADSQLRSDASLWVQAATTDAHSYADGVGARAEQNAKNAASTWVQAEASARQQQYATLDQRLKALGG